MISLAVLKLKKVRFAPRLQLKTFWSRSKCIRDGDIDHRRNEGHWFAGGAALQYLA